MGTSRPTRTGLALTASGLCLALALTACAPAGFRGDLRVSASDSGRTVSLNAGDVLLVELPRAARGWEVRHMPAPLAFVRDRRSGPGEGGLASFYFRAAQVGEGSLVLAEKPGSESDPPGEEFVLGVVVSE